MYGFGSYSEFPYSDVTTGFGSIQTGVFASTGVATVLSTGAPIFSGVYASVGVAVATSTGAPIFSGIFSSVGVAVASWIGTGVFNSVGSSSGVATATWVGTGVHHLIGSSAGLAVVLGIGDNKHIVSNIVLNLPVDFWLAGNPVIKETGRTFKQMSGRASVKQIATSSKLSKLGGGTGFTTTTNSRGFD
jgi:hypothetical protein